MTFHHLFRNQRALEHLQTIKKQLFNFLKMVSYKKFQFSQNFPAQVVLVVQVVQVLDSQLQRLKLHFQTMHIQQMIKTQYKEQHCSELEENLVFLNATYLLSQCCH